MDQSAVQDRPATADEPAGSSRAVLRVRQLRAAADVVAAGQASLLLFVADLTLECVQDVPAVLAGQSLPGQRFDRDFAEALVVDELMVTLGISKGRAAGLVDTAWALIMRLPATLRALSAGRLDLPRVQDLVRATSVLSDEDARLVQDEMLGVLGDGPWAGPSPRVWKARIERAVVRVDAEAARRRQVAAVGRRCVRAWPNGDGTGTVMVDAAAGDVAMVDSVLTRLADAGPRTGADGQRLSMDQRRADAFVEVFRRINDGGEPEGTDEPRLAPSRCRELGVVLHADTLFGDGPAAATPGQLRGLGAPAVLDPVTATELASEHLARGGSTSVLLTDGHGNLQHLVRVGAAPPGGWTRQLLTEAVQRRLGSPPPLQAVGHDPSQAISEHVRAASMRCSGYDCARAARHCDIDHDQPWPRGPTQVDNLDPKCRRHHEHKTRALVHSYLHARHRPGDRAVTWTIYTGLSVTTRPEPLPGYGTGEGYGPDPARGR